MHPKFTYEIIVKVDRECLLTVPIADFARELDESFTRNLAGIRPRLEKARVK
jgi:hypothetical protein